MSAYVSDPAMGVIMLALFVVLLMLGFPIAFSLMAMGVGFALYLHFRRKREAPSGPRP